MCLYGGLSLRPIAIFGIPAGVIDIEGRYLVLRILFLQTEPVPRGHFSWQSDVHDFVSPLTLSVWAHHGYDLTNALDWPGCLVDETLELFN